MSPTRLREILDALHWSQRDLADLLDCNERLVRRWAAGQGDVPPGVAGWLEQRWGDHQRRPPPASWRLRERTEEGVCFGTDPADFDAVNP